MTTFSPILSTSTTYDGKAVSLFEDASGLTIIDATGRPVSRARMSANAVLAVWRERSILDFAALDGACKRAAKADRAGERDLRAAIFPPARVVKQAAAHSRACACLHCIKIMIAAGHGAPVRW